MVDYVGLSKTFSMFVRHTVPPYGSIMAFPNAAFVHSYPRGYPTDVMSCAHIFMQAPVGTSATKFRRLDTQYFTQYFLKMGSFSLI